MAAQTVGWVILTNDVKNGAPKWQPDWDSEVHTDRVRADRELADCRAAGHQCILGMVVMMTDDPPRGAPRVRP